MMRRGCTSWDTLFLSTDTFHLGKKRIKSAYECRLFHEDTCVRCVPVPGIRYSCTGLMYTKVRFLCTFVYFCVTYIECPRVHTQVSLMEKATHS